MNYKIKYCLLPLKINIVVSLVRGRAQRRYGKLAIFMINKKIFNKYQCVIIQNVGHTSSNSRQTLTSLRPSWLRGDVRNGSATADSRGKECATPQCSWRLLAIALLLTCGLLAAALAYLTGLLSDRYLFVNM